MSLFLYQTRVILDEGDAPLPDFPADVTAVITLAPEDAFGVAGAERRTVFPLGSPPTVNVDFNEGRLWAVGELPNTLDIAFDGLPIDIAINGNRLVLHYHAESSDAALAIAQSAAVLLPAVLTLRLDVHVWIKQFALDVDGASANFAVGNPAPNWFFARTPDQTAQYLEAGLADWFSLQPGHDRLVSALHYYRHAKRLAEQQRDRIALLPEVVLNLAKAIEILMSPEHEKVRSKARSWGFTDQQVEQWIIPLLLVRNQIDVAHPALTPLTAAERVIMVEFVAAAMDRVGRVLVHVLAGVTEGSIKLDPVSGSADSRRQKLIAAIARYSQHECADHA